MVKSVCGAFMKCTQTICCCCVVHQEDPAAQSDPYQEFPQEQGETEEEWATNRQAGSAKKLSHKSSQLPNEPTKERSRAVSLVSVHKSHCGQ